MKLPARDRVLATAIGPYTLERRLGIGGMGEVYRAYDERLRRRVAIKHVLGEKADRANLRQRFRREARTVACLNHPTIVQIYDILETEEGDWIVMELVEGRTLRDLVDRGELALPRALRLAAEVAGGLAAAHGMGIVHRDLKLENIMVTDQGRAKILDFGLAKQLQKRDPGDTTLSGAGMVVGTIRALSPEQIMEQEVDPRSDLFSLGTLLYEVCTGGSPFKAESIVTTMTKVCRHRQPPAAALNPEVPNEVSELIDRLLEKDRERRPQSALEVVEIIDRLTGEKTVLQPLETPPEPFREEGDEDSKPPPTGSIAIKTLVAVQVADRSALADRLGEEALARLRKRLDEARRELLKEHQGRESERDDHVLLTFERPSAAIELALAYHRRVSSLARESEVPLAVRQGIHLGEVVPEPSAVGPGSDEEEATALVARHVMDLARAGQVLLTHSVDELVKKSAIARRFGEQEVRWMEHGLYRLPGIDEEVELFEVGFTGDAPFAAPAPAEGTGKKPWWARIFRIGASARG